MLESFREERITHQVTEQGRLKGIRNKDGRTHTNQGTDTDGMNRRMRSEEQRAGYHHQHEGREEDGCLMINLLMEKDKNGKQNIQVSQK